MRDEARGGCALIACRLATGRSRGKHGMSDVAAAVHKPAPVSQSACAALPCRRTQPAAMEADDELAQRATIASLPHALLARVLARVPVDTRLRCAEVCRGWRDVLAECSLWVHLDLAAVGFVMRDHYGGLDNLAEYENGVRAATALLRTAAAKARGALQTLNLFGCVVSWGALMEVAVANANTLVELRVDGTREDPERRTTRGIPRGDTVHSAQLRLRPCCKLHRGCACSW
jgi:hypothetical protein